MNSVYIGDIIFCSIIFKNTTLSYNKQTGWFCLRTNNGVIYGFYKLHWDADEKTSGNIILYDYYRAILVSHEIDL